MQPFQLSLHTGRNELFLLWSKFPDMMHDNLILMLVIDKGIVAVSFKDTDKPADVFLWYDARRVIFHRAVVPHGAACHHDKGQIGIHILHQVYHRGRCACRGDGKHRALAYQRIEFAHCGR